MQEDIENKTVIVIEKCVKLTEPVLRKAISAFLRNSRKSMNQITEKYKKENSTGKMTVKQLAAQNRGMQSIEVTNDNIGSFTRIAKKYGIDFAPYKVKGENRYLVFFKAPDTDAMTAAFKEYTAKSLRKAEKGRTSVIERLNYHKQHIKSAVKDRIKDKVLER